MRISNHALILALTFFHALSTMETAASPAAPVSHTIDLAANPEDKALIKVPIPAEALQRLNAQLEIPTTQTADSASPPPAFQGLAIKPGWGKFGAGNIRLPQKFPPGNYTIMAMLVAPELASARVALYAVLDNKKQIQIAAARSIPAGQHARINVDIYAPASFDRISLKKMDDSPKASAILASLTVVDLKKTEDPHLSAYLQVLRYPAPWGLTNPALRSRLASHLASPPADIVVAEKLRETAQRWLDQRSRALELVAQAGDLDRVVRILRMSTLDDDIRRLVEARAAHCAALSAEVALDAGDAAAQNAILTTRATLATLIADLQQKTSQLADGITRPESGTNIVSWNKNWNLNGLGEGKEYNEPTPWLTVFPDHSTLSFLSPPPVGSEESSASPVYFESTWTTNVYKTDTHRFYYTILTPLVVVETNTGRIEAETTGLMSGRRDNEPGWFALRSDEGLVLFVSNKKITAAKLSGNRLTFEFGEKMAALGYVRLPKNLSASLEDTAHFYQKLFACQPVQCAQIQRGSEVELIYEYRLRPAVGAPTDSLAPPSPPVAIAPIPHLLLTWLDTAARHDALPPSALSSAAMTASPDGWRHVGGRTSFRHRIPPTRVAEARYGINLWQNRTSREDYAQLAAQGAQLVRLVLRSDAKWDWAKVDDLKAIVQRNLAWIRETGGGKMKAYPALFGSWAPDELHSSSGFHQTPEAKKVQAEWLRRWQAIMEWCRPYADVIAYYDLLNEPRIFSERHDVGLYYAFIRENMPALRQAAGATPLLVEVANMANPGAVSHWEDVGDTNIVVGYHDYWPHMFTHQQVVDPQPVVFYPSFMPMIEWKAPSWRNGSRHWHYWDRWKCDAVNYPVFELIVRTGLPVDCGEYGVVGYAGRASESGSIWLTHTLERLTRLGANHAVWGVHGGYTWPVPAFKQTVLDHWRTLTTNDN